VIPHRTKFTLNPVFSIKIPPPALEALFAQT